MEAAIVELTLVWVVLRGSRKGGRRSDKKVNHTNDGAWVQLAALYCIYETKGDALVYFNIGIP